MWHNYCFDYNFKDKKSLRRSIMEKSISPKPIFVDPVCLMKVAPARKDFTFTYKLRTYYFCAESCRKAFETNPDKYLESKAPKRKGWWARYLERLNKATGGKPPECCS
jgi:YHS domain-containing protein